MNIPVILGTANLNSNYGLLGNKFGESPAEIYESLKIVRGLGINELDTSPDYGNAESLIGESGVGYFIQTKLPASAFESHESMLSSVNKSLTRTRTSKFSAILVHHPEFNNLKKIQIIRSGIDKLLDSGITDKVGVSVYSTKELLIARELYPSARVFQLPVNLLDQRVLAESFTREIMNSGVEIQARSVFLQGLLVAQKSEVLKAKPELIPLIHKVEKVAENMGMSTLELCLSFISQIPCIDKVVIGTNSIESLTESLSALRRDWKFDAESSCSELAVQDENILDPRRW